MSHDSSVRHADDWRPVCSLQALQLRAVMLSAVRRFFQEQGYLEVETPLLSADTVVDAHIHPVPVQIDGRQMYLQTSPEAAMKRLLASGSGSVFQVSKAFRGGERGTLHNPEFTIVEWYGVDTTYREQMRLTADLICFVSHAVADSRIELPRAEVRNLLTESRFSSVTYADAFCRVFDCDVLESSDDQLRRAWTNCGGDHEAVEKIADRDDLLNLMLADFVEPTLGRTQPEFLCDYPISQGALATRNPDDGRTACRFELYVRGVELCNGYQELTDPEELERRQEAQNQLRHRSSARQLPGAGRMLSAMRAGLPACSGVALGFDRLAMLLGGFQTIGDVLPFPAERA